MTGYQAFPLTKPMAVNTGLAKIGHYEDMKGDEKCKN